MVLNPREAVTTRSSSDPALLFGPFSVDAVAGELRRRGVRVRLGGQPVDILLLLLGRPGELVTREELRQRLWSDGTFVDFEHGLNAAINKLRRALGDSAEHPRYIETVTGRGYRFIGTLGSPVEAARPPRGSQQSDVPPSPLRKPALPDRVSQAADARQDTPAEPPSAAAQAVVEGCQVHTQRDAPRRQPSLAFLGFAAGALCLVLGFGLGLRYGDSSSGQPPWTLTRLTTDAGISDDPALSPDGTLVAYSSDRDISSEGNPLAGGLDLYIKHVASGSPIRLTYDAAGNQMPDFSPDGSRIVFRSNRNGGGIFEMPALGGEPRLIVRDGLNPRYSPDGRHVAYWVGPRSVSASVPGSGAVWVIPVGGGEPVRVGANLTTARHPVWHKDGKHLLIQGYTSQRAFDRLSTDWWVVATDGSSAVRTGAYSALDRAGLQLQETTWTPNRAIPAPRCWSSTGDRVTFSLPLGDSWNLWDLELSPHSSRVVGIPTRLTAGGGGDFRASCASNGTLAFTRVEPRSDLWLLPFHLDLGVSKGSPKRIRYGSSSHATPSLDRDGRAVAFVSDRIGRPNIWLHELATGNEVPLADAPVVQRYPIITSSGSRVAFSVYENQKRALFVSTRGAAPERVCDGCLRATDWSQDEQRLLVFNGDPYHIALLDIASHRQETLIKHPKFPVLYGRFSPDNRWVSFTARVQPAHGRIMIAPIDGPLPVPESAWVTIAEVEPDDFAHWSPDGSTLYFTSGRDGYACLWGQRLDASSHRPVGDPFAVQHFHGRLSFEHQGWSAASGVIAIPLQEKTGNLWMMSRTSTR